MGDTVKKIDEILSSIDKAMKLTKDLLEESKEPCKHEPIIYESDYERLMKVTGIKDYPDRGPSYKMYCKHCGSKIKAVVWEKV